MASQAVSLAAARMRAAIEIALARRRRADADRLVGEPNVQRAAIGFGIHGDRAQAEPAGGADDAAGDFAAICNEQALQHGSLVTS